MKLRAFVVMPFASKVGTDNSGNAFEIDFDRVYAELLEPALKAAGCEPFRADSEVSAGDIRTDMFFELVTADVVVADLSIPNPNVYYELGIRDGVCPRGVFIIHGGLSAGRPFDVASDRSFTYSGKLFLTASSKGYVPPKSLETLQSVFQLSEYFKQALDADEQSTGSPLYSHLPGLKPVDWQDIETSKARYFSSLRHNWEAKVNRAQTLHRPGNIITIADDAPTRLHRTRILSHAARSLIGLCQFKAAEQVLTEILQLTPDDLEAKHQLGAVLASLGDIEGAKSQMNDILERHNDSEAGLVLGLVYRAKWYLEWTNDPKPRERAISNSRLLMWSIEKFHHAQRQHPEQYLNGYNALLLLAITEDLFPGVKPGPPLLDVEELSTVVRYTATAARENAELTADWDTLFWSAVCLSGLAMIKGDQEAALQWIKEACDVPSATLFHLQTLQDRIVFLLKLQFRPAIMEQVNAIVSEKLRSNRSQQSWGNVVVFSGYQIGESARFPVASAPNVEQKIIDTLKHWSIGPGDLAICSGSGAGDVMFAEACLRLGAHVRLLMVDQNPNDLVEVFCDSISTEWTTRSYALVDHPETEVWNHTEELGAPVKPADLDARNKRWILNTARMEAEATKKTLLYALVLWDGALRVDDPQDPSFFIAEVRKVSPLRGGIVAIDPSKEIKSITATHS